MSYDYTDPDTDLLVNAVAVAIHEWSNRLYEFSKEDRILFQMRVYKHLALSFATEKELKRLIRYLKEEPDMPFAKLELIIP